MYVDIQKCRYTGLPTSIYPNSRGPLKNVISRGLIKLMITQNYKNKAIAMMCRKSPRSEKIYLIENHCQANISK